MRVRLGYSGGTGHPSRNRGVVALGLMSNSTVIEALKAHTRWQVANRDEIEAKYARRT